MPVKTVKRGSKFRVVESETGKLCRTTAGTPCDGGGHRSKVGAQRQASAINRNR